MPRVLLPFTFALSACTSLAACATGNDELPTSGAGAATSASSSVTGTGGAGGGETPPEPDLPPKLTIVNGVNDYDAIRLCFVPYPDGGDSQPFPSASAGIPFAGAVVIDTTAGVLPTGTDVYLSVITGDLTKASGKGCAELTSGTPPPGVLVAPLAVLPAAAITAQRSLLLVPSGCVGGTGHTDPNEKAACGELYSLDTPSLGLLAAGMSRVPVMGTISIQGAHGAPAMQEVDLRVLPGMDAANPQQLASSLSFGAVQPFPPFTHLSRLEMGSLAQVKIQTYPPGQTVKSSENDLLPALERGGLMQTDFEDGRGFTFVATGAQPGLPAGPFWHALTWTVVTSDP